MHSFFICRRDEVNLKLTTLTKTGVSDDGLTQYYTDRKTKEEWLLTQFHAEYHGGGVPILKRLPEPEIDELIEIAVTSDETNDVLGLPLNYQNGRDIIRKISEVS